MERGNGNNGISPTDLIMNKRIKIEVEAHNFTNEEQKPRPKPKQAPNKKEVKIEVNLGVDRSRSVSNLRGKAAVHLPTQELPRASRIEKMKAENVFMENGGSGLHNFQKQGVDVKFPDNVGAVNGPAGNMLLVQGSAAGYHFPQVPAMMTMGANLNNTMLGSSSTSQIQIPNNEHGFPRSATAADSDPDGRQILKNAMLNMPHVSTKGNGSKRIEGILYKYARLDELKIVCACHGLFFSPAEFIRHGGGRDVEQPLKHIFVNLCPLCSLLV